MLSIWLFCAVSHQFGQPVLEFPSKGAATKIDLIAVQFGLVTSGIAQGTAVQSRPAVVLARRRVARTTAGP